MFCQAARALSAARSDAASGPGALQVPPCQDSFVLFAVLFDLADTLVVDKTASRSPLLAWAKALGLTDPEAHQRWARVSARHYSRYQRRELTFVEQRRERVR